MTRPLVLMFAHGGPATRQAAISAPLWERAAARWGADFRLRTDRRAAGPGTMEKLRVGEALRQRPRVLLTDADTVVHPAAPDPFEIVPATHLGALVEWPGRLPECWPGHWDRFRQEYDRVQTDQGWEPVPVPGRFNSGVLVASAAHAPAFDPWAVPLTPGAGRGHTLEESWVNVRAVRLGVPVCDLGFAWNAMRYYRREYDAAVRDGSAWVYHLCGHGFDKPAEMRAIADRLYPDRGACRHRSRNPVETQSCCGAKADPTQDVYGCDRHDRCATGFALQELTVRRCRVCPDHAAAPD